MSKMVENIINKQNKAFAHLTHQELNDYLKKAVRLIVMNNNWNF